MFGIFAVKHPGTVEVSNGMGFLGSHQHSDVVLFKTETSQESAVWACESNLL